MYYLKADGMKTAHTTVRSAKREGNTAISCGAFDAYIYNGAIPYAYKRFDSDWKRIYHTPKTRKAHATA